MASIPTGSDTKRHIMFDYIIVGAGSAGCVLANRLTEDPQTTVLLLEAGGPDDNPLIHTAAHWPQLLRSEVDWAYETEAQPHLHGRTIYWPRGKVLGGTGSLNAMLYVRGNPYDYDHWAAQGNEGWNYAEVLPYFKKSEHNERGASDYHGVGGLLNVADLIEPNPVTLALLEAAAEIGIPANDDPNSAQQEGVGLAQVTQKDGQRHSTATAFLRPAMQRANLTVETHAQVTRLLVEDKRIVGVSYVQNGATHEVRVHREVILSGGTVNSPQILLLSGIGPAAHLQAHGIPVVVDLPGVGQNLHDHPAASLQYRPSQPIVLSPSSSRAEGNVFTKTRPDVPAPDLQLILFVEETLYSLVVVNLRPESRGTLTLASADPFAHPRIDPNHLDSETDRQVMFDGFKLARKIGQAKALDTIRAAEHQPGEWLQTDEGIRAFIRENASTVFHPVGTYKMGHDPLAVVNDRLQVQGVQGLRVVDASIMPTITSGNTNAPVIMIAEKAADLIKQD